MKVVLAGTGSAVGKTTISTGPFLSYNCYRQCVKELGFIFHG